MLKNLVSMKAIAVGTVGGAFGCIHVDPDNPEARIVNVTEAGAQALEKKNLARRQKLVMVDEDDAGEEDAAPSATSAMAQRLEDADHGPDRLNTGGDTRDTTAFQKDPLETAAAAAGAAPAGEGAGEDAAPIEEAKKEPAKEPEKEPAKGTAAKDETKAPAKS